MQVWYGMRLLNVYTNFQVETTNHAYNNCRKLTHILIITVIRSWNNKKNHEEWNITLNGMKRKLDMQFGTPYVSMNFVQPYVK